MQNGGVDPTRVTRGHAAAMANPAAQATTSQPYTLPTLPGMEAVVNGTQGDGERLKSRKELEMEKKDLELGELLEMMDEWRPIVSLGLVRGRAVVEPGERCVSRVGGWRHALERAGEWGRTLELTCIATRQIPDEVTDYYLQRSGFETSDLRV